MEDRKIDRSTIDCEAILALYEKEKETSSNIESMHMIFKGQIRTILDMNTYDVKMFIERLFEVSDQAA